VAPLATIALLSNAEQQISEFGIALRDEVLHRTEDGLGAPTALECFTFSVLEMFEDAGVVEEPVLCVQSGRLGRLSWEIAGWAFPLSDDEDLSQGAVVAAYYVGGTETAAVNADDLRRRFELAVTFIAGMLEGRFDELDTTADVVELGRTIHERRGSLQRITVYLATDGITQRLKAIESESIGGIEVACSIWDLERLSRLADPKQEEIEIDVPSINDGRGFPCLKVPEDDDSYEAFLCVIPGSVLYHAYERFGQRLLEQNVRAFLSATGKVNKGIRDTIRNQPDRFFAYNNGLALTARNVVVRRNEEGQNEVIKIVGLQVVNGGQTTASLHRAWKLDGLQDEVTKVHVQAKLTVITTAEDDDDGFVDLVRSISKFANSQNAVKDDDLEANQPWHIAFEKLSRTVWTPDVRSQWFYERSRGSYATAKMRSATTRARKLEFERQWPRTQLVSKTDLAKSWNSWAQRPEVVSLGGQKNFRHFMGALDDQVRRPRLTDDDYKQVIGRVILLRDTTRLVNQLKDRIPAYRANVVTYLVAYLSFRMTGNIDLLRIWEKQTVPETVKDVLRAWAVPVYEQLVNSAGGRNVTEWCKKPECWNGVRAMSLRTDVDLSRFGGQHVAGSTGDGGLVDVDDAAAISECMRISVHEWEKLMAWVMRAERVHPISRGIASTLRMYALDNWSKAPSVKQARSASKLIRRWRAEEGLESATNFTA
jgi:AIPR protein